MRVALLAAVLLVLPGAIARADMVDPCPPGFRESHTGCHFGPTTDDLGPCAACSCLLAGVGGIAAALVIGRRGREKGRREG